MNVSAADPEGAPKLIFASLDAGIAQELEPRFADAGCAVISNSSAFRMHKDVPLVIPEVNPDHLKLVECQSWRRKSGGFIVTNSNCSVMGLVLALAPLHQQFGLKESVCRHHAGGQRRGISGRGLARHPGQRDSLHPKEEEKMEEEAPKMLGRLNGSAIEPAPFRMSVQCNRVAVEDGHTESVAVKLAKPAKAEAMIEAWRGFSGKPQEMRLPDAPEQPIKYDTAPDRPSRGSMPNAAEACR